MNSRLQRARRLSLPVVLELWALVSCQGILGIEEPTLVKGGADASVGATCTLSSECTGTEVCLFQHCSVACKGDKDCAVGSRCLATSAVVRLWERHPREHPEARTLPPVLPLVVHHGPRGWRAPTQLGQLFAPEVLAMEGLRDLLPSASCCCST